MMSRISELGGTISQRRIANLSEAAGVGVACRSSQVEGKATLVVNCAGLMGGSLAGDDATVKPIRGQILRVKPTRSSLARCEAR